MSYTSLQFFRLGQHLWLGQLIQLMVIVPKAGRTTLARSIHDRFKLGQVHALTYKFRMKTAAFERIMRRHCTLWSVPATECYEWQNPHNDCVFLSISSGPSEDYARFFTAGSMSPMKELDD